ncbi:hypothetical protein FHT86_005265 [Rhizobium sp. BK313]|jgi:hypothetical protein|nr:hypothetical protein [Rhizobium sp. BK313]
MTRCGCRSLKGLRHFFVANGLANLHFEAHLNGMEPTIDFAVGGFGTKSRKSAKEAVTQLSYT